MNLLILGAGEYGQLVKELARNRYTTIDFLDDKSTAAIGKLEEYKKYVDKYEAIVAIGNNEISNPSSYYKKYDEEYYRYKLEQKKYLDYNYKFMMDNEYKKNKKEPNVNPYNPKNNVFLGYKSDLIHNPILNPVNHYGYNKYLRKELDKRENEKLRKFLKNYLYSNKDSNID